MPSDFDHYSIKIKWAFHLKEEAINNKKENTCYSDGVYLSRVYCMKLSTLHIFLGGLFLVLYLLKCCFEYYPPFAQNCYLFARKYSIS